LKVSTNQLGFHWGFTKVGYFKNVETGNSTMFKILIEISNKHVKKSWQTVEKPWQTVEKSWQTVEKPWQTVEKSQKVSTDWPSLLTGLNMIRIIFETVSYFSNADTYSLSSLDLSLDWYWLLRLSGLIQVLFFWYNIDE